ncbi:MAG: RIP metalloprotease RseP [Bacilli bacterium]|nr:RIP metalloprotease RseP [Bacilli bacterium]
MLLNILSITSLLSSAGSMLLKILLLIFILGIIILVHEFGHFIWAKTFKVHIYEFSIGMGPLLFSHKGKKDNINYNIRAIPIGGFVSMAGEVYDDDDKIPKEKLMCNRPWYQRCIILAAGVMNNFIMAIVLLILYGAIWGGGAIEPNIEYVAPGSAAEMAGLQADDTIVSINGHKVSSWDKAQIILQYKNDKDYYTFVVERDSEEKTLKVTPKIIVDEETGVEVKRFGIEIKETNINGFFGTIAYGFKKFASIVSSMAATIGGLFSGNISVSALSGPVGIYEVVGASFAYTLGYAIQYLVYILAFLSINVGFINILPFPAFDGGHLFFLLIEKIKGSPVNAKFENICHLIGFALIFLLMIYVTINDIIKLS